MSEAQHFQVVDQESYKPSKKGQFRSRPTELGQFMTDRVNKLRELYEAHTPQRTYKWVLPKGETDGRKAIKVETIMGDDVSPFDLPDFEKIMPKPEDYCVHNRS